MRFLAFAARNRKELLRDPLTMGLGIGLPMIILLMFSLMQRNMPFQLYAIENLTPGIAVFGYSFISLFSGMLISKDRTSSFLIRIFASPLTASDYFLGYSLPLVPIAMGQSVISFAAAIFLGLPVTVSLLPTMAVLLPIALLYMSFGILFGTVFSDKQVGGMFSIFVNITTWLSGTWFELNIAGNTFRTIAYLLPFPHAVDAVREALSGYYSSILPHLAWVIGYAAVMFLISVVIFKRKMKG